MKHILNQTGTLLVFLLLLYGLLLVISLPLASRPANGALDTASAASSVFMTEPKYAFLSRSLLDTTADKTILLGASNVLAGFRPGLLQSQLSGASVHNLAIGGANMTEVRQMVDLILEVQSPDARPHNFFVIGVWYGLFAGNAARWNTPDRHPGDTDLDIERYRYGFYRRTAAGPVPLLPPQRLRDGVTLITPFLVLDRLARDASKALGVARTAPSSTTVPAVPSLSRQRQYLDFWDNYMGGSGKVEELQFNELLTAVDRILDAGGQVLLVDLPLPRWHASGSSYEASYRKHWQALQPRLTGQPGVYLLSLQDADQPEDFSDEVHPREPVSQHWAKRLATRLNALPVRVEPKPRAPLSCISPNGMPLCTQASADAGTLKTTIPLALKGV